MPYSSRLAIRPALSTSCNAALMSPPIIVGQLQVPQA